MKVRAGMPLRCAPQKTSFRLKKNPSIGRRVACPTASCHALTKKPTAEEQ
jgi:hypothetical protein